MASAKQARKRRARSTGPNLAKLTIPRLGQVHSRPRLLKQCDRLVTHKLVWIAAPAGSGKTTLLADYLGQRKRTHLWYQVDAGDQDIASFFNNLASAAERGSRLKRKLARFTPEYALGLPAFSRNYFRELFARLKAPACIVLDNYQDVGEGNTLDTVLAHALDELPDGITLIALSRTGLPAALARHDANGHVAHLDAAALALTADEEVAVVKLTLGERKLKPADLARLHQATHGWMAGLLLALREVRARAVGEEGSVIEAITHAPAQDPAHIFDYFVTEVMARLDPATREFLYAVALFPVMTAALCEQLTGNRKAKSILQRLVHEHFFTNRRGLLAVSYEFHPLFRQFLLVQSESHFDGEQRQAVMQRAGRLLDASGQVEEAATLYMRVCDWSTLAALICKHAARFISEGRSHAVEMWLSALPEGVRSSEGWLEYWFGACRLPYNPSQARVCFERAFERFEQNEDVAGLYLAWAGVAESYIYASADYSGLDLWIEHLPELQKHYPEPTTEAISARVAFGMFAALMARNQRHPNMSYWEERARSAALGGADARLRMLNGHHLVLYYTWWNTDLAKAETIINLLRPMTLEPSITPLVCVMWHSMEAIYNMMLARPDESLASIKKGLALAEQFGMHVWSHLLYGPGVWASLTISDAVGAADYLARMAKNLNPSQFMNVVVYHGTAGIEAYWRGDIDAALKYTLSAYERAGVCGVAVPLAMSQIGVGRALSESGDLVRAGEMFAQAYDIGVGIGSAFVQYLARFGQAVLARREQNLHEASEYLAQGFKLTSRLACYYNMWLDQEDLARLCVQALTDGLETDHVRQWIKKRKLLPPTDTAIPTAWPWPVRIYTLDRFAVQVDDLPLPLDAKGQKKPFELLKAIVALGGRNVPLARILEALWPEAEGDAALRNFTITLHRLRQFVGSETIVFSEQRLSLDARRVWVDLWPFERQLSELEALLAHGDTARFSAQLAETFGRYRRPFLDGEDAAWAAARRERLRHKLLRLFETGAEALTRAEDHRAAIVCCERGVEIEPLAENLHRLLMKSQLALGEHAAAVATYRRCHARLQRELGVAPSASTEMLHQQALRG